MDGKTIQFSVKKTIWKENPSIVKLLSWKSFPSKKAYFWLGRVSFQCLTDRRLRIYYVECFGILKAMNMSSIRASSSVNKLMLLG